MLKSQQRNWDRIYHVPIEELVAYLKENELPSNATDGPSCRDFRSQD